METYIFIGAHPDDIETMLGYHVHAHAANSVAVVASDGEDTSVNLTDDATFITDGKRRAESRQGLAALGIADERQIYLGMKDGGLADELDALVECLVGCARQNQTPTFVTLGETGFDHHPDHIASHQAAVQAQKILLARFGILVSIQALNPKQAGEIVVPAADNLDVKLGAMACNASQFPLHEATSAPTQPTASITKLGKFVADTTWWDSFAPYHPLVLSGETYDTMHAQ